MNTGTNILILSCGIRNKIVQYFKNELKGKGIVVAADSSELAPALYEADKHYIVPRINENGYLERILQICKENNIKAVLSLIDPELIILAKNREKFLQIGTKPIVSDYKIVEMCFDKYKMYNFLVDNNLPTVKSYIDKDEFYREVHAGNINYPVFVKPVRGSASININKVYSDKEIDLLFSKFNNLMIQEFMEGKEYGIDVYIDMLSLKPVTIFIKEKIKMRAGETDKSVSVKKDKLFHLVKEFVKKTGVKGVLDIDIFEVNGEYYISEVNPRFGGGYPHAYECGVNIPKMIIKNVNGLVNSVNIGNYDDQTYMMKYNELIVIQK